LKLLEKAFKPYALEALQKPDEKIIAGTNIFYGFV